MKAEDVNRALDKSESVFDSILISVAGWPKPFTSIACITVLVLAGIGFAALWVWL